jgi:transcription initiation factor TFIIIB Brf1 subunit/transcription initiation factor TFIIB
LDARQRARAKELARDLAARRVPPVAFATLTEAPADEEALAAAVAYAIVYVDHVPLTQAEVAGCFRVSVPNLRGRFKHLRAMLDLTPGDVRYATVRRR